MPVLCRRGMRVHRGGLSVPTRDLQDGPSLAALRDARLLAQAEQLSISDEEVPAFLE